MRKIDLVTQLQMSSQAAGSRSTHQGKTSEESEKCGYCDGISYKWYVM